MNRRNIEIETNFFQQSHGSARVRFSNGGTDVLTSVKAEVQQIFDSVYPKDPIEVSVFYTASASVDYHRRSAETEGNFLAESVHK